MYWKLPNCAIELVLNKMLRKIHIPFFVLGSTKPYNNIVSNEYDCTNYTAVFMSKPGSTQYAIRHANKSAVACVQYNQM